MAPCSDGPRSALFEPVTIRGNTSPEGLAKLGVSETMAGAARLAPSGKCVCMGIPFKVGKLLAVKDKAVSRRIGPLKTKWLVFMHTTDMARSAVNKDGFTTPAMGTGRLAEHVADYVVVYADGTEARTEIRRRHQVGMLQRPWGENCFQAVAHRKPLAINAQHEQPEAPTSRAWGQSQYRTRTRDSGSWVNWLWAWQNPHPNKLIAGLRFEPLTGTTVISGVTTADVRSVPLRWESRKKAILRLPKGVALEPRRDNNGLLEQIQLDLGQVISATPRRVYPNAHWAREPGLGTRSERELIVEYTAHPDARFHLAGGVRVPAAKLLAGKKSRQLRPVRPANQRVVLRVVDAGTRQPVPVRLHVHGEAGEYLAPIDRHRIPNPSWFEDYSTDLVTAKDHYATYIDGETVLNLPLGKVYVEVTKGFEIRPVRKVLKVTRATRRLTVRVAKVLPWRERGWVSADTHVHFLSPHTARLEGSGEGVNVVNLLASQWGELMTNVGDFDGKRTLGSKETGGDGEHLVRVGTENRQHVLGHISLLGYEGRMISPMCSGGPNESALGDAIDVLLTEWARQCRDQNGIVVIPHFPNPRAEHAAAIVNGLIDGIELGKGMNPYSLSDWYRYLNCGYFVPAVSGTDKMSAQVSVGACRTYARLKPDRAFTYEAWKDAIRSGNTFATTGPLLEFAVDGKPAGSRIAMKRSGGTVDVTWEVASVTRPMSRVDLIVNGEVRESMAVDPEATAGYWSVDVERSSWLALLVRCRAGRHEAIAAHSSPVMVEVEGSEFFAAADAVTILDQIEGALAYLDTIGTRAGTKAYKRMRLELTSAHRALHNRLHQHGDYHRHTPITDHAAHHR